MNDSLILKIAMVCSIVGLISLFIISGRIKPSALNPATDFESSEFILVNGTIEQISKGSSAYYIKVFYTSEANIVAFSKEDLGFESGDRIEITGKTGSFKGGKQIIADKIRLIE